MEVVSFIIGLLFFGGIIVFLMVFLSFIIEKRQRATRKIKNNGKTIR